MKLVVAWLFGVALIGCDASEDPASDTGLTTEDVAEGDTDITIEVVQPASCASGRIRLSASIAGLDSRAMPEVLVAGTVASVDASGLELTTAEGSVVLSYELGPHALPVQVGDAVELLWRAAGGTFVAIGFALFTADGAPLAIVDTGSFGSAWNGYFNGPVPAGFEVATGPAGCATMEEVCKTTERLGLTFTHGDATVAVEPGGEALIDTGIGRFRVVDAWSERLTDFECTDVAARVSWLILAD